MSHRNSIHHWIPVFVLACLLAALLPASVAQAKVGWQKTNKGYVYKDESGKKAKASRKGSYLLFSVGDKSYAVNSSGYQVHGWRRIGKKYYYFAYGNGSRGFAVTDTRVNGITLSQDGTAKPTTKRQRRKLKVMNKYSAWADQVCRSNPLAPKKKKLKTVYLYLRHLPYRYVGELRKKDKNRDLWGAEYVSKKRAYDCHPAAAAFAYMANAIGYTDSVILDMRWPGTDYWHSFNRVDGRYYDLTMEHDHLNSLEMYAMKTWHENKVKYKKSVND